MVMNSPTGEMSIFSIFFHHPGSECRHSWYRAEQRRHTHARIADGGHLEAVYPLPDDGVEAEEGKKSEASMPSMRAPLDATAPCKHARQIVPEQRR
jgi:hypothetical protein